MNVTLEPLIFHFVIIIIFVVVFVVVIELQLVISMIHKWKKNVFTNFCIRKYFAYATIIFFIK